MFGRSWRTNVGVSHLSQGMEALHGVAHRSGVGPGQRVLQLQVIQELQEAVCAVTAAVGQTCVGRGRGEARCCRPFFFFVFFEKPSLTVGLVGGGRVRRRRPVDDGVGGEVGELRYRSQQAASIFFFGGGGQRGVESKYAAPVDTTPHTQAVTHRSCFPGKACGSAAASPKSPE